MAITAIGNAATAIAAIEHGKVDAGMMADPSYTLVSRRNPGVRMLADLRTAGGLKDAFGADAYPGAVLYAKTDWIRAHRDTTARLARAVRRTLDWMQKSGPQAIGEKTPKALRGEDEGLYVDALKNSLPMFSPDGVMTRSGAEIVQTLLAGSVDKVKAAWPDAIVYVYDGVDHGFNCDHRGVYDEAAAALARNRTLEFFAKHVG